MTDADFNKILATVVQFFEKHTSAKEAFGTWEQVDFGPRWQGGLAG